MKPGHSVYLLNAPKDFTFGALPASAKIHSGGKGPFDMVIVFVSTKADVQKYARQSTQALSPNGLLWFAYPKKTSRIKTDISRDTGWDGLHAAGMTGVSLIAMNDTWSAMRFRPTADITPRTA